LIILTEKGKHCLSVFQIAFWFDCSKLRRHYFTLFSLSIYY